MARLCLVLVNEQCIFVYLLCVYPYITVLVRISHCGETEVFLKIVLPSVICRDGVLEASASARGGLEAVFFS